MTLTAYTGADVFDGHIRHRNSALLVDGSRIAGVVLEGDIPANAKIHPLPGGTIAPGFVDLQVNGGGGVLFNDAQRVDTLRTIAQAHTRCGTTSLLPTLITDTPEHVRAAIDAVEQAIAARVPGIIGLHIEGPHLSIARKGAHNPDLIRKMEPADMALLLDAVKRLPILLVTVAPENVTPEQIKTLTNAGVLISLGHTDAPYGDCKTAAAHGATCATHLFNAMSQFTGREPGLVGAALDTPTLHAGLIADGIHVCAASIRTALAAKQGPAAVFLVTDAMSTVGSDITEFTLDGRTIYRRAGRLTLADGTLAGADLNMPTALRFMTSKVGVSPDEALKMATSKPVKMLQNTQVGQLVSDGVANFVHLDEDLYLTAVWQSGTPVSDVISKP
ncbi:N-acetylglucosamine-6-phosphate deacetylase [Profundibacter sp.]